MVNRKAIIIGNSGGYRGLSYLPGVAADIENYSSFLMSKAGGEWRKDEIATLENCDSEEIFSEVLQNHAEYTFITFSGHGLIANLDQTDYISVKNADISIATLIGPCRKQTIILDVRNSCIDSIADNHVAKELNANKKIEPTRELFDESILKTPDGILLLCASGSSDFAFENASLGGYFTSSFLRVGKEWGNVPNNGILKIDTAFERAKKIICEAFKVTQIPIMGGQIRRLTFPPFSCSN
jgi:hypothetical protein